MMRKENTNQFVSILSERHSAMALVKSSRSSNSTFVDIFPEVFFLLQMNYSVVLMLVKLSKNLNDRWTQKRFNCFG